MLRDLIACLFTVFVYMNQMFCGVFFLIHQADNKLKRNSKTLFFRRKPLVIASQCRILCGYALKWCCAKRNPLGTAATPPRRPLAVWNYRKAGEFGTSRGRVLVLRTRGCADVSIPSRPIHERGVSEFGSRFESDACRMSVVFVFVLFLLFIVFLCK